MRVCQVEGCRKPHHAKNLCGMHYSQYRRTAAIAEQAPAAMEPDDWKGERRKPRTQHPEGNFDYFTNQDFIEKVYQQIIHARNKPLYKTVNGKKIDDMIYFALILAGYDGFSRLFTKAICEELRQWAEVKDKIRFMHTLETWEEKAAAFESPHVQQMNIFQFTAGK